MNEETPSKQDSGNTSVPVSERNNPPVEQSVADVETFYRRVGTFSDEVQTLISGLSSSLLEPDIYNHFRGDPLKLNELAMYLKQFGVSREDAGLVMGHFNLPMTEEARGLWKVDPSDTTSVSDTSPLQNSH